MDSYRSVETTQNDGYFISFAFAEDGSRLYRHNFIIISKRITSQKYVVMASFGLFAESKAAEAVEANEAAEDEIDHTMENSDSFVLAILSLGTEGTSNGRIRCDDYYLTAHIHYEMDPLKLYVRTYPITQDQAISILEIVKEDSKINVLEKKDDEPKMCRIPNSPSFQWFNHTEQELIKWFKNTVNQRYRGGPPFNAFDFNCKSYASNVFSKTGLRDPAIQEGRFPNKMPGSSYAQFKEEAACGLIEWDLTKCDFNSIEKKDIAKVTYPKSYFQIFCKYNNPVQGALALLKDYSDRNFFNKFFHPKRHHGKIVRKVLREIERNISKYTTIRDVISRVESVIPPFRNSNGSLQKRLDFLTERVANPIERLKPSHNEYEVPATERALFRTF